MYRPIDKVSMVTGNMIPEGVHYRVVYQRGNRRRYVLEARIGGRGKWMEVGRFTKAIFNRYWWTFLRELT